MESQHTDLQSLNSSEQLDQILSQSMNDISLHRALTILLNESFPEVVEHDVCVWTLGDRQQRVHFDDCRFTHL